ncbi:MAG TPA: hypothetical protein VJH20_03795 [Candidatus Nanoarchaeia archaeon]|nr:hypothetical protein [Candidatus Nanoarchaeia archaeon]
MSFAKPATGVIFIDDESEVSFNSLAENSPLKKSIRKAISDLKENVFCGESVKKEKIPKIYIKKYKIDNLWWYPLSEGWRLVYSIMIPNRVEILGVILEYFNHKDYERRFGYK